MGQDGRGGDRAGEGRACEMLGLAVTADEARLSEAGSEAAMCTQYCLFLDHV